MVVPSFVDLRYPCPHHMGLPDLVDFFNFPHPPEDYLMQQEI